MSRANDVDAMEKAAAFFRRKGLNPLATCGRIGHPTYPHADYRDFGQSGSEFTTLISGPDIQTPAIQLACGVSPGLIAIDIDGEMARDVWADWSRFRDRPPTWEVETPSGGHHVYYRLPKGVESCPKRISWRLDSGLQDAQGRPVYAKHELIEVLGDGSLVMAPPSFRDRPGKPSGRYRWSPGCSPREFSEPAIAPDWIIGLPNVVPTVAVSGKIATKAPRSTPTILDSYEFTEVKSAIPPMERVALASDWGLRLVGGPARSGWIKCRAVDREDSHPSAGFHPDHGYVETGRLRLGFFDLAVYLGRYKTKSEACNSLGSLYLKRRAIA